ncbi:phospholipase [Actinoplanes sp. N902-109]|uniref:phospholipase n=1 Tax=Actinoplanes sp. (strain N902-109) TaxID=649831 RepID=UPI00032967AF|nr:phospholipase [Actinoplanes sp. N902-109]AGL21147.1 phospholipase a2 [Actinoplanes sp. N902-109]
MNRLLRRTIVVALTAAALVAPAQSSFAATQTKAEVLSGWTQTTAASTAAWNAARLDRGPWASYGFDWSTDYCSSSPDNPLGFTFELSCWHHDFGYRNYKDLGTFSANKDRLDNMFYADLKRVCATYSSVLQPACYSLAWTYYQAVHIFGSLEAVNPSDVDKARALVG